MSHGSCVAARDGDPAPPASSTPAASAAEAARASSAHLACLTRGLTVIVESAFLSADLVGSVPFPARRRAGQIRACARGRGPRRPFVSDHNLSFRLRKYHVLEELL